MNTLYKNLSPKCHHKHLRERFPPDYNRLLEFQRMSYVLICQHGKRRAYTDEYVCPESGKLSANTSLKAYDVSEDYCKEKPQDY